jgi:glycosyltransferase involved in cell wall biosynthesis
MPGFLTKALSPEGIRHATQACAVRGRSAASIAPRRARVVSEGRKIIFVNRFFAPDQSATSRLLSDLAFHLASRGMNVAVVASRGLYDDPGAALPAFETIDGVAVHRPYRPRFGRHATAGRALDYLAMYRSFAAAVARLARPGDHIVAKTDPPMLSAALAPVARARGARLVNWLQDLYPEVALGLGMRALAPAAPLLRAARDASLSCAARNVAIGERMRERLGALGLAEERIEVIPNWCDDRAIVPRARDDNPLRSAWGLGEKFVVGYSGNLGRAHDYATLLDAADRLRDEADLVFLFIGGGRLAGALAAEAQRRGLDHLFQFRPYQDESLLPLSLALPDIHWISLRPAMEGLIVPSKFCGVAAAGRGVIAIGDPAGELASLIAAEDCGASVEEGDSARLAELILTYKYDASTVARLGHNARKLLDRRLSRRYALDRWEFLLNAA